MRAKPRRYPEVVECPALQLVSPNLLNLSYMRSGNYEEAIHITEKIVEQLPTSVSAAFTLASSYASNGMLSKAF